MPKKASLKKTSFAWAGTLQNQIRPKDVSKSEILQSLKTVLQKEYDSDEIDEYSAGEEVIKLNDGKHIWQVIFLNSVLLLLDLTENPPAMSYYRINYETYDSPESEGNKMVFAENPGTGEEMETPAIGLESPVLFKEISSKMQEIKHVELTTMINRRTLEEYRQMWGCYVDDQSGDEYIFVKRPVEFKGRTQVKAVKLYDTVTIPEEDIHVMPSYMMSWYGGKRPGDCAPDSIEKSKVIRAAQRLNRFSEKGKE